MAKDKMSRHESFLDLMRDERARMDRLGLPAATLIGDLESSVDRYRQAARAGRESAMRTARREADRELARCLAEVARASALPERDGSRA